MTISVPSWAAHLTWMRERLNMPEEGNPGNFGLWIIFNAMACWGE